MRKLFLFLTIALLTADLAEAQCRLPLHKGTSREEQLAIIKRKLSQISSGHFSPGAFAKGAAGTSRLVAQAAYDLSSGSTGFSDSLRLFYSGTRASSFDFDNLQYDFQNSGDLPGFAGTNTPGFVQFDSLIDYNPTAPMPVFLAGLRQYNAGNKVLLSDQIDPSYADRTLFTYNAQGKVSKATFLSYDQGTGVWDSTGRDFYIYSTAGFLVRDSSESWDSNSSIWEPNLTTIYTNNSGGYPTMIDFGFSQNGTFTSFYTVNLTFAGANLTKYILQIDQGNGLENFLKDSIGYSGNTRTYINTDLWDAGTNTWVINTQERRHLNSTNLPDSVWQRYDYNGSGTFDTSIQKFTYNTDGNPTYQRYYLPGQAQALYEVRWYYSNISNAVSDPSFTAAHDALLYPNPAGDAVYLKDATLAKSGSWQYTVLDAKGALIMQGSTEAGSAVRVSSLPTGLYLLNVWDRAGKLGKGTFVKQ